MSSARHRAHCWWLCQNEFFASFSSANKNFPSHLTYKRKGKFGLCSDVNSFCIEIWSSGDCDLVHHKQNVWKQLQNYVNLAGRNQFPGDKIQFTGRAHLSLVRLQKLKLNISRSGRELRTGRQDLHRKVLSRPFYYYHWIKFSVYCNIHSKEIYSCE